VLAATEAEEVDEVEEGKEVKEVKDLVMVARPGLYADGRGGEKDLVDSRR
jgi:hypothetical protein